MHYTDMSCYLDPMFVSFFLTDQKMFTFDNGSAAHSRFVQHYSETILSHA